MKCHIAVDAGSGFVHTMTVTAANEHDINQAAALIREDDEVVYGDSGYPGVQIGYKKTVYRGLKKNENRLYAMFACANLYSPAIAGRKLFTT